VVTNVSEEHITSICRVWRWRLHFPSKCCSPPILDTASRLLRSKFAWTRTGRYSHLHADSTWVLHDTDQTFIITAIITSVDLGWPYTLLLAGMSVCLPRLSRKVNLNVWEQNLSQFYAQFFILQLMLQHVQRRGCDINRHCCYFNAEKIRHSKWAGSWLERPKYSRINLLNEMQFLPTYS
jgi:hypothetical protein